MFNSYSLEVIKGVYDVAYDIGSEGIVGNVYGDIDDAMELQVVENPYYGSEIEANSTNIGINSSNKNDMEIFTSRKNDYYEL